MTDSNPTPAEIEKALEVIREAYVATPAALDEAWRTHRARALRSERGWLALDVLLWTLVGARASRSSR